MHKVDRQPSIRPAVVDSIFAEAAIDIVRVLVDGENKGVVELAALDLVIAGPEAREDVRFVLRPQYGVIAGGARIACHDPLSRSPEQGPALRWSWEIRGPAALALLLAEQGGHRRAGGGSLAA